MENKLLEENKTLLDTFKNQIDQSPEPKETYVETNEYKYTQEPILHSQYQPLNKV